MHSFTLYRKGRSQRNKVTLLVCLFVFTAAVVAFLQGNFKPAVTGATTAATVPDSTIIYSKPIVIIKGGTYTGNWESKDSNVPAIEVNTSEPVIIENSNIRGAGPLIRSIGHHANISVRHTNGYGIAPTPWRDYKKSRRFLAMDVFKHLAIENCYMENTAGIYLGMNYTGNGTTANTVRIRYNKVKNIDGRVYGGKDLVQFVQFNFKGAIKHVEIAWNQVINEPNNSAVEDNINIFNSRGTPDSPIRIHNNFIKGAYPFPADNKHYTGGGILMDAPGNDTTEVTAYVKIYDNQLVGLGNHCIGIAGGNNIEICNNRAVVAAQFSDGTPYKFWTSGIWAKDYYKGDTFFDNKIHHNTLAVTGQTSTWRNDISDSTILITKAFDNLKIPGQVTREMEEQEFLLWQQKLELAEFKLGPQTSQF